MSKEEYDQFIEDLEAAHYASNLGYGEEGEGFDYLQQVQFLTSKYQISMREGSSLDDEMVDTLGNTVRSL